MARVVATASYRGLLSVALKVEGRTVLPQTRSVKQQAAKSGHGEGLKEMDKLLSRLERKMAEGKTAQASSTKPAAFNEVPKPVDTHNPHSKEVVRDNAWEKMFY